jgi:hypothetical protein
LTFLLENNDERRAPNAAVASIGQLLAVDVRVAG